MPKFEFESGGKKWEVEAPDQNAALAAWNSTQQSQGSTMGQFGRGVGQGLGRSALDLGSAMVPGGPTVGRFMGRTLEKYDPTGATQAVSGFVNEPSKSTAQTAGQFTGAALPAFTPMGGAAGAPSLLAGVGRAGAYPLARLVLSAAAHKLGPAGRALHRGAHQSGLLEVIARGMAHGISGLSEDASRGLERLAIAAGMGREGTKERDNGKEREPRSDARKSPAPPSRPPTGRPREADDRNNRSTKAERFDSRWQALGDL